MGNIPGVPDFPADGIKECAEQVMSTFAPEYTKQFALHLVKQIEMEKNKPKEPDFHLLTAPADKEPLMEGWIVKQGAIRKNWKKRYFVAMNKADNFVIHYFKSESDKKDVKKAAGSMFCCNYVVKKIKKEEQLKKYGEFSLKFKPYSKYDRRRKYFLRFENEEELKAWSDVLENTAKKAKAPLNENWVMQNAFKAAYRRTRWALWVWGWYTYNCTEDQMLSQLIVDRCERDIMQDVYAKIPAGKTYRMIKGKVQGMLDTTVGAVVGAGWKGCVSAIESAQGTLEETLNEQLDPIFSTKVEIMNKVKDGIVGVLAPILSEIAKPVLSPVLEKLLSPMVDAFAACLKCWHKRANQCISNNWEEKKVKSFKKDLNYYYSSPLYEAYSLFRDFTRSDVMTVLGDLLYELRPWRIEDIVEGRMKGLVQNAIYTFQTEVDGDEEAGKAPRDDFDAILKEVTMKLTHDMTIAGALEVSYIFECIIMPPFQQKLFPAIKEIIAPISKAIPDLIKNFIDPDEMVDQIMNGALKETIEAIIGASSKSAFEKLEDVCESM
eukprot:TRINITY_DN755174_c0_g1_i1.p1 TRINITY_DN755174_c0_g1~~TRINITY_DN755174_c0_g1_i1.p1  ORF type:complete len:549 (+),score=161.02 TRINITY_DN755174_c0_g1_i1:49-1695(+)